MEENSGVELIEARRDGCDPSSPTPQDHNAFFFGWRDGSIEEGFLPQRGFRSE